MPRRENGPPPDARTTTVEHRVPFYETDAMGVVHHSNYVRFLELARIVWLDEHHRPYRDYVTDGLHFATTRVEVDYLRSASYDDVLQVVTWLEWVRGASLRMAYEIRCGDAVVSRAATEHAVVDLDGRLRRIPRERRAELAKLATAPDP